MFDNIDEQAQEVYLVLKNVDKLCGDIEHLQMFKRFSVYEGSYYTTYYQTSGGGPEGGYFVREFYHINCSEPTQEVYCVERSWGEPFKVKRLYDCFLEYDLLGDGTAGCLWIVPN
jgi:hypothetical protein